ncbi:DUF2158 domain-containing protein [Pseudomonas corrugata]|uniref:DUF2158 domain-containing protein n=1 Tax=Pseudomonas corrugata TaxID=47879 RepID=UPI00083D70AB|nr:DUF2158 domain-containing protein [Pseudomonas corrugata]AOE63777.1 hypothetical protein AXG94_19110 [Pseudomonas corrugata]
MSEFLEGQVVRLKSGGPDMVIYDQGPIEVGGFTIGTKVKRGTLSHDFVLCEWMDGAKRVKDRFKKSVLEHVSE